MTLKEAFRKLASGAITEFTYSNRTFNKSDLNNVVTNPTPRTDTVEVKRWVCIDERGNEHSTWKSPPNTIDKHQLVELIGTYQRPVPDESEVFELKVVKDSDTGGAIYLPKEWIGKWVRGEVIHD